MNRLSRLHLTAFLFGAATSTSAPAISWAQGADKSPAFSTQSPQSMGIKAFVTNLTKTDKGFTVEMDIENLRKTTVLIAPISTDRAGGGNTAIAASGKQFIIAGRGRSFVGMDPCYQEGQFFSGIIGICLKSVQKEQMTQIEPMQRTLLGATYEGSGDPGAFVSFAFKFVVRDAPAHSDTLSLKSVKPDAVEDQSVVTLSFSRLPFPE